MKAYAEQIRPFIPKGRTYKVLGTDGFGRSDFRSKLREHFEVNRHFIVVAALRSLATRARCRWPRWPRRSRSTASRPTRSTRCTPDNLRRHNMALVEIKVPDIGDFDEVAVIELLVKPGDTVAAEQSLITVESDKASMEIPSSTAGVVKELRVKLGDKVSEGSVVLVLEAAGAAAAPAAPVSEPKQAQPGVAGSPDATESVAVAAPAPAAATGPVEVRVPDIGDFKDVAVIEVFVKPGDTVKLEQSLITVESDKASMEIPSSAAGVVRELKVKLGDTVNIGDLLAILEGHRGRVAPAAPCRCAGAGRPAAAAAAPLPRPRHLLPCPPTTPPARRWGCRTHRPRCASSPANWACR
jgi:pyruvate/2-oxoglutarate dehydrogenase complex dihydrolipoamide acyltransferase (E2) component